LLLLVITKKNNIILFVLFIEYSTEHKFANYTASTIAASSIAASVTGLKWDLSNDQNFNFLLNLLTDLTSVEQVCI